jgi:hypothetical protein
MRNAAKIGGTVTKKKKYYGGGMTGDPKKPAATGTPATSTPPPTPGMGRPSPSGPGVPTRPFTPPSSKPSRIAGPPVQTPQDRFKAEEAVRKAAATAARKKADNAAFNERMNQLSKEANPPKKPIGPTGYSRGGTTKKKMAKGGPVIAAPIQTRLGNKPMAGGNMAKGGSVHPGFKAVQAKIAAKQGLSKKVAGAILAAGTRKASAKAKAANPRLKRVKG